MEYFLTETASSSDSARVDCTTCTLVSFYDNQENITGNLIVLADGHIQSIVDYDWDCTDYGWRISTMQTRRTNKASGLMKMYLEDKQRSSDKQPISAFSDLKQLFANPESFLEYQLVDTSKVESMIELQHQNIKMAINSRTSAIRFVLTSSDGQELDAVKGSMALNQVSSISNPMTGCFRKHLRLIAYQRKCSA